jgi:hypothetical protein
MGGFSVTVEDFWAEYGVECCGPHGPGRIEPWDSWTYEKPLNWRHRQSEYNALYWLKNRRRTKWRRAVRAKERLLEFIRA